MLWENHPQTRAALLGGEGRTTLSKVAERVGAVGDRLHLAIELHPGGDDRVLYTHPIGYLTLGEIRERVCWGSFEVVIGHRWQGRGYGRRVLEKVPELLMSWRGIETIKVGAFEENLIALGLYRSLGFFEVERVWYSTSTGRRRAVILSNKPEVFLRHRVGFF
jgi:GNAT superfamily N-acetyltransferase